MILNNKHVRSKGLSGFIKKKLVEVVVAYSSPNVLQHPKEPSPEKEDQIQSLARQIQGLEDILTDVSQKLTAVDPDSLFRLTPEAAKWYRVLMDHDVDQLVAKKLMEDLQVVVAKVDDQPESVLRQLLLEKLGETAPIKLKKYKRTVIMLVGPTGVGKTTTLVKLAGKFITEQELKVGLINADTYRIGAHDQIRTYADIMRIPLHIAYTPEEIVAALQEQEDRELVLIDTMGKNSWDESYQEHLKKTVEAAEPDEVLLLISVNTSRQAIKGILDNYSFLERTKLVITKTDEVAVWGNMVNIVDRAQKTLAYLTTGQNVPHDLEEADVHKIVDHIVPGGDGDD